MRDDVWNVGASYQPNLVLSVDYKITERATGEEPTGEVMPLTEEHLHATRMGDKYERSQAPTGAGKKREGAKRCCDVMRYYVSLFHSTNPLPFSSKASRRGIQLEQGEGLDMAGIYKPKTEQSKQAFNVLLSFVQEALGDQPREVLYGAADEVLRTLKKERIKEGEKKKELESLLEKISPERFADMVSLAKQMHDFHPDDEDDGDEGRRDGSELRQDIDESVGVSVRLEDDEDEDGGQGGNITYEVSDGAGEEQIDEEGVEAIHEATLKYTGEGATPMEVDDEEGQVSVVQNATTITLFEKARTEQAAYMRHLAAMGEEAVATAGWSGSRRVVDLEDVAFSQGSHLMTNKKCVLPEGSQRTNKRSYESIFVPALKPKPFGDKEKLIQIEELPKWARDGFKGYRSLNRIQSRISKAALHRDENLLICAPTGAGKTNVALMCILREISKHMDEEGGVVRRDEFKCIYIAPMRSLVQEMVGNFKHRLEPYGLEVGEMTGDVKMSKGQFAQTQVVVCTPEKYDIITRKGGEQAATNLVTLIIFDEIHLLHDDRGPVLEALVARVNRRIEKTGERCRLVGLSATLPNYKDVAEFLRVKSEYLFHFDNSYQPAPLEQEVKKTAAELAFQRRQQETADRRLAKKAAISHREKVERFNKKMEELSEFNDIPKVSWTK